MYSEKISTFSFNILTGISVLWEDFQMLEAISLGVFQKKDVLQNFVKFTGKHLWQSLLFSKVLKKRLWHRCFLVNYANFLRTPFSHLWETASGMPNF